MNRSRLAALSAGAMFLVASVLVPATAFAAGSGTLSLSQATVSTTTGSTFSVSINSQAAVPMSGAAASVDFDRTKLQIVSVSRGADWNVAGTAWVDATVATIANANATGHLSAVSAFYTDGTSSRPANTNAVLATVTFFAIATGTTNITLPTQGAPSTIVPSDYGSLIDGTAGASYGSPVATTSTGTAVTITAGVGSSTSTTANITGSVDSGYVSLTCPTTVTVPLVRNVVNTQTFICSIGSNVTWTLSTQDNAPAGPTHGHMTDASQTPVAVLADSLHVLQDGNSNVDLSGAGLQAVSTGQNNIALPLTFSQNVRPSDKPGAYGMSVLFSITSTF